MHTEGKPDSGWVLLQMQRVEAEDVLLAAPSLIGLALGVHRLAPELLQQLARQILQDGRSLTSLPAVQITK